MEFNLSLDRKDLDAFEKLTVSRAHEKLKSFSYGFWWNMALWFVIAIIFFVAFQIFSYFHWPTFGAATLMYCAVFAYFLIQKQRSKNSLSPKEDGIDYQCQYFSIDEDGISATNKHCEYLYRWPAIIAIEREKGYIVLYIDTVKGLVFPEAKLDNPDKFYEYVRSKAEM